MAFDFPNTPSVGDLFQDSSSGAVYRWNGYAWVGGVTGTMMPGYLPLAGGVMTGPLTPAPVPGIVGVSDGSNAAAGAVGEVISGVVTTGVSMTSNIVSNVSSISLTAGDWDVSGEVWFTLGTGGATSIQAGITPSSAAMPGTNQLITSRSTITASLAVSFTQILSLRPCRVNVTGASTPYYLTAQVVFPSGTTTTTGNIIARRAR